jgi:hypothetical protein
MNQGVFENYQHTQNGVFFSALRRRCSLDAALPRLRSCSSQDEKIHPF